jgi:RNA polymerase sigma factor (sigma-70 family)
MAAAGHGDRFATTRWSIVVAAGQSPSPDAQQALSTLCEAYWYPLYAYIRRRGYAVDDAQDLTQAFFTEVLAKNRLSIADPRRGKFRSFLLTALKNFLAKQWRAEHAQKRGGTETLLPLDFLMAETRYSREPGHELTAEKIYERRWALTLLECVLARLASEQTAAGKSLLFDSLKTYLGGDQNGVPYREIADRIKMTEGAVKVAVHRLRRRYRELLHGEIADTVTDPEDIDDELRALFAAVAR